jgi:RNA polymerase subunit RPABC4/transcription elongation factor Spt4
MFCLKCGRPTGRDSEFCDAHADDSVTDQSLKVIAEEKEHDAETNILRCPACNQRVFDDQSNCPACGAHLPVQAKRS